MTETDSTQGTARAGGIAPMSVGLKYHFIDAVGSQRPSVGVIVRFFPRSGSCNFGTTRTTGDFRIVADWDFLPEWSLKPNVGVVFYESDGRRLYAAGLFAETLTYNPNKSLNFFIDTGLQSPEARHGRSAVIAMSVWPIASVVMCSSTSIAAHGSQAKRRRGCFWRLASARGFDQSLLARRMPERHAWSGIGCGTSSRAALSGGPRKRLVVDHKANATCSGGPFPFDAARPNFS